MKLTKKNIYISLFVVLYSGVALVSLIHAVSFFALANLLWLAILLAIIFEIGQSAVLFSILTSSTGKSKIMPWILMCILTAVQILGNVFSSYKYIVTNSPENLRFFKEPVFIWTTIPDAQATVIITYIVGGILPLVALAMSAMVTNYLEHENNQKNIEFNEVNGNPLINDNAILQMEKQGLEEANKKKDEQIENLKKDLENEHSLYGDIAEEFPKTTEEFSKKDEEIEKLKKELEELKQQKENLETHIITFKDGDEIVRKVIGIMGTYVSVPNVEKEGYEFLGWSIDGKNVTMPVDGIYDSDITYIALWNKLKKEDNENKENKETLRNDRRNDQVQQENEDVEQSASEESKNDVKDSGEYIKESDITTDKVYDSIVDTKKKEENILEKENLEQVEDLIKNGIHENKEIKPSHFINQ